MTKLSLRDLNEQTDRLAACLQVIRHPRNGSLTSLDFGPVGGRDIAFTPARKSQWRWGRKRFARAQPVPKGTPGEVRELPVGAVVALLSLNVGIFGVRRGIFVQPHNQEH